MEWNNGREQKIFNEKTAVQKKQMRKAGMPEEKIEEICTYDRKAHNRNRAFAEQTVSLDAIIEKQGFNDEWGMKPLLEKNMQALSVEMEIDHNSTF